ncbi:MAG: NfeD family protein, partial [Merdibacter sp.]
SLIALCVIRPLAARSLRGNVVATNADRLIGAMAVVEKRISAREWGSVRIEGNVWSAIAQDGRDIEPGTAVRVKAIEGVKLIVVPVNGPKGE